jgi:transcriptional regulator with XRE-family HTH domain
MSRADVTQRFAANMRELRIGRGVSQGELARILGMTENYLYRLERAERAPSMEVIAKVAEALKVDPAELIKEIK